MHPPPLQRGLESRFARARRGPDSLAGQGGVCNRARGWHDEHGAQHALPPRHCDGQARAHGDAHRLQLGFGKLCGSRARAGKARLAFRFECADLRRGQDGRAHGAAPRRARRAQDLRGQPPHREGRAAGRGVRRRGRPVRRGAEAGGGCRCHRDVDGRASLRRQAMGDAPAHDEAQGQAALFHRHRRAARRRPGGREHQGRDALQHRCARGCRRRTQGGAAAGGEARACDRGGGSEVHRGQVPVPLLPPADGAALGALRAHPPARDTPCLVEAAGPHEVGAPADRAHDAHDRAQDPAHADDEAQRFRRHAAGSILHRGHAGLVQAGHHRGGGDE